MTAKPQRVLMIHDASRDVSSMTIIKALKHWSLKAGDHLTTLAILDRFSSPSMFSFLGGKLLGYKVRVNSSSIVATNKKIIDEELSRKKDDCHKNQYIMEITEYCEKNEIVFQTEVVAGPEVAYDAARRYKATRLIFDRQTYKDMKRIVDKFPCGMYRITSDNSIERLKDPKLTGNTNPLAERPDHLRYTEMIPGSAEEEFSLHRSRSTSSDLLTSSGVSSLLSIEASTSSYGGSQYDHIKYPNIEQETEGNHSLFYISENQEAGQVEVNHQGRPVDYKDQHSGNNEVSHVEEEFTNSLCSVCNNKRPKFGCKRDFSYAELHTATQGFSQKNFLSEGGFGSVYKGHFNGMMIAVKQHKNASFQGEKEFKSEVNVLGKARHENVVMLLGSCSEGTNRLLVYEYVCNGSLDQHLSQHSRALLTWENRIKVAIGAAKGLLYLHNNTIIHRDMRLNNILITHDHQPLLGDFGLARTQHHDLTYSTEVVGTLGYLAPEYAEYGKVSTKTDVYSFGVILLQLITGMRTTDKRLAGRSLVGWARPLLREKNYPDLIDERIMDCHDFHQLFWMVRLAEKCLSRDPHKRLNMVAVVNALTDIVEGSTCGTIIKEYSSTRSGSFYSTSDSDEPEDDMQGSFGSEGELQSHSTESISSGSISFSMQIVRQPPSPPIQSISSSSSTTFESCDESTIDCEVQSEGSS